MEEIRDGETVWRFDEAFLGSTWTCLWGRGCLGILPEPAPHLGQGCCSVGADLDGEDEARAIVALAATLDAERFQHHAEGAAGGVVELRADGVWATRIVDGACVFLNRPGHPGGAGCALHLEATATGDSPIEWKPSVCWQLPIHVDHDGDVATVRGWSRRDWGREGETMAWCCTEDRRADLGADAYAAGTRPVVETLGEELTAIVGPEVYVELRRRLVGE